MYLVFRVLASSWPGGLTIGSIGPCVVLPLSSRRKPGIDTQGCIKLISSSVSHQVGYARATDLYLKGSPRSVMKDAQRPNVRVRLSHESFALYTGRADDGAEFYSAAQSQSFIGQFQEFLLDEKIRS